MTLEGLARLLLAAEADLVIKNQLFEDARREQMEAVCEVEKLARYLREETHSGEFVLIDGVAVFGHDSIHRHAANSVDGSRSVRVMCIPNAPIVAVQLRTEAEPDWRSFDNKK